MEGMTFGMDGMPDLEGTIWWSRDGSDHFTVRSVIMDPAQGFIIQTMDGRHLNGSVFDRYIQSDKPVEIPQNPAQFNNIDISSLDEVSPIEPDMVSEDDEDLLNRPINTPSPRSSNTTTKKTANYDIIDKAFTKVEEPLLSISLKWNEYPVREIELLQDIMNIPTTDIADYIFEKYLKNDIDTKVKEAISVELGIE